MILSLWEECCTLFRNGKNVLLSLWEDHLIGWQMRVFVTLAHVIMHKRGLIQRMWTRDPLSYDERIFYERNSYLCIRSFGRSQNFLFIPMKGITISLFPKDTSSVREVCPIGERGQLQLFRMVWSQFSQWTRSGLDILFSTDILHDLGWTRKCRLREFYLFLGCTQNYFIMFTGFGMAPIFCLHDFGMNPTLFSFTNLGRDEPPLYSSRFLPGRVLRRQFFLKVFPGQVPRRYVANFGNYGSGPGT